MISALNQLFVRDLEKLATEINAFRHEPNIWKTVSGVSNSSGNLCLHICGNLQHFIGATLGETGYERDRDHEFSGKDISRFKLISAIESTKSEVKTTLEQMTPSDLEKKYPLETIRENATTEWILLHLYSHLSWHLGQINYLRRILES